MSNGAKDRFIELLEEDAAQAHKMAEAWKDLQKQGGRLLDKDEKPIATAAEMVVKFAEREKELRALIAQIKAT